MKKLLIMLGAILLVNSSTMFADTIPAENKSSKIVEIPKSFDGKFTEPIFNSSPQSPLIKLQLNLIDKSRKKEYNLVSSTSVSIPASKFQILIDKNGNPIDVSMLESTDMSKDQVVLSGLQNGDLFTRAATFDGQACASVCILSVRYTRRAPNILGYDIDYEFFPLIGTSE